MTDCDPWICDLPEIPLPDEVVLYSFDPEDLPKIRTCLDIHKPEVCPGVYVFFAPQAYEEKQIILYVGRALKIRNRLRKHWKDSDEWQDKWWDYSCEHELEYGMWIAIWYTENRESLERLFINKLSPLFNIQRL